MLGARSSPLLQSPSIREFCLPPSTQGCRVPDVFRNSSIHSRSWADFACRQSLGSWAIMSDKRHQSLLVGPLRPSWFPDLLSAAAPRLVDLTSSPGITRVCISWLTALSFGLTKLFSFVGSKLHRKILRPCDGCPSKPWPEANRFQNCPPCRRAGAVLSQTGTTGNTPLTVSA